MRTTALFLTALLALASPCLGKSPNGAPHKLTAVPKALDAFYPPKAGYPAYLVEMVKLDTSFSGIVAELMDGDLQGARSSFEEFKAKYRELAGLVPEWRRAYPLAPVEKLGKTLGSGDRGKIMAAFADVGRLCHECHTATMVPVQQKYHWGDFSSLQVKDPLSNDMVEYARFKKFLSANLAGITVNLKQGQTDAAVRHFQGLRARYEGLKETCKQCHTGQSRHYVDGSVDGLLDKLGEVLDSPNAPQAAGPLLQRFGAETCSKCHHVHVPAAVAKAAGN
jgi:hypothetical protein